MMGIFSRFRSAKPVQATIPNGRVLYRFRALQNFWEDSVQTEYVENMVYSVREGNVRLAALVDEWTAAGKVEVL